MITWLYSQHQIADKPVSLITEGKDERFEYQNIPLHSAVLLMETFGWPSDNWKATTRQEIWAWVAFADVWTHRFVKVAYRE